MEPTLPDPLAVLPTRKERVVAEPMYRCPTCLDSGWQLLTAGVHQSAGSSVKPGGEPIDAATTEIVRRCKGPRHMGCPWDAWDQEQKRQARGGVTPQALREGDV